MKVSKEWREAIRQTALLWSDKLKRGDFSYVGRCPMCDAADSSADFMCDICLVTALFGVGCDGYSGPNPKDPYAPYYAEFNAGLERAEERAEECATAVCLLAAICEVEI